MSPWELYWLLKLDTIGTLFQLPAFFLALGLLIAIIGYISCRLSEYGNYEEQLKIIKKIIFICLPIEFIFIIVAVFLPSTKQMATIIVVPKIINAVENNKALMELPNEVATLASNWIKELQPENFNKVPADTINPADTIKK